MIPREPKSIGQRIHRGKLIYPHEFQFKDRLIDENCVVVLGWSYRDERGPVNDKIATGEWAVIVNKAGIRYEYQVTWEGGYTYREYIQKKEAATYGIV